MGSDYGTEPGHDTVFVATLAEAFSVAVFPSWLGEMREQWAREDAELEKARLERPLLGFPPLLRPGDPGYREALDKEARRLTGGEWGLAPIPVCECGVAITGGLHSDWCPLYEEPGV